MSVVLTQDQQNAYDAFIKFVLDPDERAFVLEGYSGTGKSTLISHILNNLDNIYKIVQLINPKVPRLPVTITATTNKAAENLSMISGSPVPTIQSHLGLRVLTNWKTGETNLVPTNKWVDRGLIIIDEASFIDSSLLEQIFKLSSNSKIVFIGDPAQLAPVKCSKTPVFEAGFPTARLTKVVRQSEGNPIIDLATKFRNTVNTGEFFSFVPDGISVIHLGQDDFAKEVYKEFLRKDWHYNDSKVLAWTNKRVNQFNQHIFEKMTGNVHFSDGDYAVVNKYISYGRHTIKTDQLVCISRVDSLIRTVCGISMLELEIDHRMNYFLPISYEQAKDRLKQAVKLGEADVIKYFNERVIDLRPAYACTVNKSQGSTYNKVFIDLSDIASCNSGEQIARMMYVAVSRARHQVFLTGDFV